MFCRNDHCCIERLTESVRLFACADLLDLFCRDNPVIMVGLGPGPVTSSLSSFAFHTEEFSTFCLKNVMYVVRCVRIFAFDMTSNTRI